MAMIFETSLWPYMSTHPVLAPTFEARVYPMKVPQNERRRSLTYQMASRTGDAFIVGQSGKDQRLYIFTVWDKGYMEAKEAAELLMAVFDQRQQTIGAFSNVLCLGQDQRDVYDDQAQLFGVETDVQMTFINHQTES